MNLTYLWNCLCSVLVIVIFKQQDKMRKRGRSERTESTIDFPYESRINTEQCPVCKEICCDEAYPYPVNRFECGHGYLCQNCWNGLVNANYGKTTPITCPVCRKPVKQNLVPPPSPPLHRTPQAILPPWESPAQYESRRMQSPLNWSSYGREFTQFNGGLNPNYPRSPMDKSIRSSVPFSVVEQRAPSLTLTSEQGEEMAVPQDINERRKLLDNDRWTVGTWRYCRDQEKFAAARKRALELSMAYQSGVLDDLVPSMHIYVDAQTFDKAVNPVTREDIGSRITKILSSVGPVQQWPESIKRKMDQLNTSLGNSLPPGEGYVDSFVNGLRSITAPLFVHIVRAWYSRAASQVYAATLVPSEVVLSAEAIMRTKRLQRWSECLRWVLVLNCTPNVEMHNGGINEENSGPFESIRRTSSWNPYLYGTE